MRLPIVPVSISDNIKDKGYLVLEFNTSVVEDNYLVSNYPDIYLDSNYLDIDSWSDSRYVNKLASRIWGGIPWGEKAPVSIDVDAGVDLGCSGIIPVDGGPSKRLRSGVVVFSNFLIA